MSSARIVLAVVFGITCTASAMASDFWDVMPTYGVDRGGTRVALHGPALKELVTVSFGDKPCTDVTNVPGGVECTTPAASTDSSVDITIRVADHVIATLPAAFAYFAPLGLSIPSRLVAVNDTVTLSAAGGIAPYRFSATGAGLIDGATGVFVAGAKTGQARVRVEDSIGNAAEAELSVGAALVFYYTANPVHLGETASAHVEGGVQPYRYELVGGSRGSLVDAEIGVLHVGDEVGPNRVAVTDALGNRAETVVMGYAPGVADPSFGENGWSSTPVSFEDEWLNQKGFVGDGFRGTFALDSAVFDHKENDQRIYKSRYVKLVRFSIGEGPDAKPTLDARVVLPHSSELDVRAMAPGRSGEVFVAGTRSGKGYLAKTGSSRLELDPDFGNEGVLTKGALFSSVSYEAVALTEHDNGLSPLFYDLRKSCGALRGDCELAVERRLLQTGSLDKGFGHRGTLKLPFRMEKDSDADLAMTPQGALIATGTKGRHGAEIAVAKVDPWQDGSLVTDFAEHGVLRLPLPNTADAKDCAYAFALYDPQKWALYLFATCNAASSSGGQWRTWIARIFEANGALDTAFGQNGVVMLDGGLWHSFGEFAKPFLLDGSLVVETLGREQWGSVRLDATGHVDPTYGLDGYGESFAQVLRWGSGPLYSVRFNSDLSSSGVASGRINARRLFVDPKP